jgi:hypothetical protein
VNQLSLTVPMLVASWVWRVFLLSEALAGDLVVSLPSMAAMSALAGMKKLGIGVLVLVVTAALFAGAESELVSVVVPGASASGVEGGVTGVSVGAWRVMVTTDVALHGPSVPSLATARMCQ